MEKFSRVLEASTTQSYKGKVLSKNHETVCGSISAILQQIKDLQSNDSLWIFLLSEQYIITLHILFLTYWMCVFVVVILAGLCKQDKQEVLGV